MCKTRKKTKRSTCPGQCKRDAFREWKKIAYNVIIVLEKTTERTRSVHPLGDFSRCPPSASVALQCTLVVYDNTTAAPRCPNTCSARPAREITPPPSLFTHRTAPGERATANNCAPCRGRTSTGSSQIKVRFLFV